MRPRWVLTITAAAGLAAAGLGPIGAAAAAPAGSAAFPRADWQQYVVAPSSREVRPVRVIATTGTVVHPDALLHGGIVRLIRPEQPPPPTWPSATTATASSYHAPNGGDNGTPTTYDPSNAIDGNPTTFWNDANPDTYPAWLQITSPTAVTLPGITLLSSSDGVPEDFTVAALEGGTLQTVATVTGNAAVQVPVSFSTPVTTTEIRITVTLDQSSPEGDFTRINEVYPAVIPVQPAPSITLDYGKDVVGFPQLSFAGASGGSPGIRVAYSETKQYLTDRSDFTRSDYSGGPGTDQHAPSTSGPSTWTDTDGCQDATKVCADGLHGFRYEKITLDALPGDAPDAEPSGEVDLNGADLQFSAYLGTPSSYLGWFDSSDPALDRYWYDASYTNELVTDHFEPGSVEPRGADSPTLDGKLVLMDGAKRDRDPYDGDLAVSGLTDYLTHDQGSAVTDVLADLADHQLPDGYIPPASINNYTLPLFEYPLYWAMDSWEYVLYNGIDGYGRQYYPNLVKLLNTWYPSVTDSRGLLDKGMNGTSGFGDYAFLPRSGEVTYYNDLYVLALRDGAKLATALGDTATAAAWRQRATEVSAAINQYLWDPAAGAYLDSDTGAVSHPQDGNAWAVVAGVARGSRATSALDYLSAHTQTPYGNAFWDNDSVVSDGTSRVYAFTSYPEIVARFETGQTGSALDEIDRLYGCMASGDPGITDWEGITTGCEPYEGALTSMAHGWSTGVLPALTNELLGVSPAGPGFNRWVFAPHPGTVAWTEGQVPTPHGPITAKWRQDGDTLVMQLRAPSQTSGRIAVPTAGAVWLDGRMVWDGRAPHRGADGVSAGLHDGSVDLDVAPAAGAGSGATRVFTVVARGVSR